jgi:hypothetical protein
MLEHVQVPRFPPPRIGEPARFNLVHHAEVLTLPGDSDRTRARRELLTTNRPTMSRGRPQANSTTATASVAITISI